jgi:carbon-monoxide dehydrogenase large subunit
VPGSLLGNNVRRVEDPALVQGQGTFVDNIRVPDALWLAFVRSPFPHARIESVDIDDARKADGVVEVYTSRELELPRASTFFALNKACDRPPLAVDKVRFVGDIVAVVVAETAAQAVDAVELVDVDYDPLSAEVDMEGALRDGAALQFEELGTNVADGERDADSDRVLDDAEVVVRGRFENQRLSVAPIEPNVVLVQVDDPEYDVVVHMSTQMPHGAKSALSRLLDIPKDRVRVVAPHVGGAFGGKAGVPAEHVIAVGVARQLERATRWTETRSEAQLSMHGRGQVQYAELGLTRDGTITGLRIRAVGDSGAYAGFGGALVGGSTRMMAHGVYRIPKLAFDSVAVLTNTTPMGAFRGAGRPEAAALLERLIDLAADELDLDPIELRRRNFIQPDAFPYATSTGATYDVGDFDLALREVLRVAAYDDLLADQRRRREANDPVQLGIGIATYVEVTGGGSGEFGAVDIDADGVVTVRVGTSAHGQGHATTFSMVVADRLGVPMEQVRFVQSDTAAVPRGQGTGGSRSLQLGGSALGAAADLVVEQGRELAGRLLEAPVSDIELGTEGFGVVGVPTATVSWTEVAKLAADEDTRLGADHDFKAQGATFPFGAHLAVVEVDTETGLVRPIRLFAVDDCGRIVNPLIVAGQQHGGAAQGVSQALWEKVEYDEDGQPVTATFADYSLPTAADMPDLVVSNTETPSPLNPLGAKGIGESATIGSTPAVQNAVVDALSHLGVRHVDMPCTPRRVWQAMRDAAAGQADSWREPPAVFATLPVRGADDEDDEVANI